MVIATCVAIALAVLIGGAVVAVLLVWGIDRLDRVRAARRGFA